MTLNDLLTELRENILFDRSDRISGQSDRMWSDETLVRYINEAQRRFARGSLCIRDASTTEVCRVTLVADEPNYALDPSVLAVISAKLVGDQADLARAGHSAFDTYRQPDPYFFDTSYLSALPPGKPLAYSTDEEVRGDDYDSRSVVTLRIYPVPNADYEDEQLALRVCRLPINNLTANNLQVTPEIPEDHHLEMLDWAAYLALRVVDLDAGHAARASEFRASFEAHVKAARNSAMRKLFAPALWGFGRNGFSWER